MMKRFFLWCVMLVCCVGIHAQGLKTVTWSAYGLTFKVPETMLVEEDSEFDFLLNNALYYVSVHSLESDDMDVHGDLGGLSEALKTLADEDEVTEQSEIVPFDLKQFYGVWLTGKAHDEESCYCACLMTKDAGSVFYISVIYNTVSGKSVERILKSFRMEEE